MARKSNRRRTGSSESTEKVDETKSTQAQNADGSSSPESDKGKNDVAWYARDPQLCIDASRVPFSLPFGAALPYSEEIEALKGLTPTWIEDTRISAGFRTSAIPGICTLKVKPSFGTNNAKTDPVNVCANAFYTHVRYMNSGRKNYDPADLFLYAATFGELISFLVFCKRLYSLAFMYSQRNYYIGKVLIEANGFNADEIVQNLANFRYWINVCINKIASFCLPGDIYYFNRRAFMFGNYYIENPYGNIKDQIYQFIPDGFYRFELDSETGAGILHYDRWLGFAPDSHNSWNYLVDKFNYYFENITGDEDFGIMSGDILKAYGDNRIFLASLGEDATLMPVYDPFVLSQFKNATLQEVNINKTWSLNTHNVNYGDLVQVPGDGNLYSRECVSWFKDPDDAGDDSYREVGIALQMHAGNVFSSENPSPDVGDVIEGTRLMVCPREMAIVPGSSAVNLMEIDCGTEICVGAWFTITRETNRETQLINFYLNCSYLSKNSLSRVNNTDDLIALTAFKYAPNVTIVEFATPGSTEYSEPYVVTEMGPMSNLENTTIISPSTLKRIHEMALLSLFYVPGVAKIL